MTPLRKSVYPGVSTLLLCCLACCGRGALAGDPLDWPCWRGPQQNSTSTETGLIDSWDPAGGPGSNLLWKNSELGSRSTPIVMDGRLYTLVRDQPGTPAEAEKVVCVDAATGEKLWEYRMNVYLCEVPDTRVGWSSCVGDPATGRVYAQSVSGYFCCLEGTTGKLVWDRSLQEEIGLINTYGGRTNFPLVFEDLVITSAVIVGWGDADKYDFLARPAHRFLGLDKATGAIRWLSGTSVSPYDTTYSTPTIATIEGQAVMVFASGDGQVWAFQPRTGKRLWNYPFSRMGINVSPLVLPNGRVIVSHSEENTVGNTMGSVSCLDGSQSGDLTGTEIWRHFEIMAGKSSPVMLGDRVYVVDDRAKLFIFAAQTGELIAREALGTAMRSTPLVADGKLYVCTNAGRWYILRPTADGVEKIHRLRLEGEDNDGSPIVSHGRIYLPTSAALYCLGRADSPPAAASVPPVPPESPAAEDPQPAVVQVEPYDALLQPGATQNYRVRLFNSRGQLLEEVPPNAVQFSVDGPGSMSDAGTYTAPADHEHQVAVAVCRVGDLTGTARIRIVPPLPWSFDFDQGDVPLTWIGGRVRFVIREEGGQRFLAKRDVLPTPKDPHNKLGTRSQLTMGPISLADYTIQADFALQESAGRLPDFGVINSRYTLAVRSQNRELRLYSWSPHDYRTYASVAFDPQPGQWYTMKLRVDPQANQVTVRGKLWPRDADEPSDWTVQMDDPSPNLQGSPGLFGKSEVAEIFVDNVKVYPNQ